jgi:GTPase SAR1 family protein
MHATHQFFLSRRALYILVLDGRKEEDAEYWLKHIESFGGDSPILVVLNKMDQNPGFDVNRPFLKQKYPGIRDFYRISCFNKRGLKRLRRDLLAALAQVEMVHAVWPETWFRVKTRLEAENADFISLARYKAICHEENISQEASSTTLVRYLHDLGTVLHFEDLHLLDTQVLNPRWVTHAVYRIVNSEQLADCQGILELRMLDSILARRNDDDYLYPEDKYRYIVDLMKKFELCYELDAKRILVPDLLQIKEPFFIFPGGDVLWFSLEYDFLPRSVMPRFIVKRHHDIKGELRWRSGVVLEDPTLAATSVVKADLRDRRIIIAVTGEQSREYLAVIRGTFREIHDSFRKLEVKELVPLPDHPAHYVPYQELVGHELMGQSLITIGTLRKQYQVQDLLNGIETPQERHRHYQEPDQTGAGGSIHHHYHEHREQVLVDQSSRQLIFGDGATIHGDIAVAEQIRSSFNKAGQAQVGDELRAILQELIQAVAEIATQLPRIQAQDLADDLKTLTDQATKEHPRRKWWQLSSEGIREAAKAAGTIGEKALSLLDKLLPLLGP